MPPIIIKVTKGSNYCYIFPENREITIIEKNFDTISDNGFTLKSLTEIEYETEIEFFNMIERSDFETEMLEMLSFEVSDEFSKLLGL